MRKTEEEWKKELTGDEYIVLRKKGTEKAFSGEYNSHYKEGVYNCKACGEPLFSSSNKFDSGSGWPSFDREIEKGKIVEEDDKSFGLKRTEIKCHKCDGHLGHVFDDGPTETGKRYCVNSISLLFDAKEPKK